MIGTKIRYLRIPNALTPHYPLFAPIRIVQPNHHRLPIFVSILVPIIVAPILVPIIVPIIGGFNHKILHHTLGIVFLVIRHEQGWQGCHTLDLAAGKASGAPQD
jgi:hypothetical protein